MNYEKKIWESLKDNKVELKAEKIELGLLQDLKQSIDILKKADSLSNEVIQMYNSAVKEAKSFNDRYNKTMLDVATIGADLEDKAKELGIDTPKEVKEALKAIDNSEKNLRVISKIAKG